MDLNGQKSVLGYFLLLFAVILYFLMRVFEPFINTLLISLILAGLFYPVFQRLELLLKGRRSLASLVTCLLVLLTVFIPLVYLVAAVSNEAYWVYSNMSDKLGDGKLEIFLEQHRGVWDDFLGRIDRLNLPINTEKIEKNIGEMGTKLAFFIYDSARTIVSNLAQFFLHFLFLLLILYYLFLDGVRFRNFLFSLSPLPDDEERFLVEQFNEMALAVFLVNGLGGLLQGMLGGLGFWAFGLPSPVLWGSLMAILAFLPLVGISIVYIPATLFLLFSERYLAAVSFFVCFGVISVAVEYLIKPRLVGKQAKMHILLIFISLLGGLSAFGILGILYGPLIMTAFLSLTELYKKTYERALLGE